MDDIRQLVKRSHNVYEKGYCIKTATFRRRFGLRDLLMKDLERVNSSSIVVPKAPELTTELEQVLHHVNTLVLNQSSHLMH